MQNRKELYMKCRTARKNKQLKNGIDKTIGTNGTFNRYTVTRIFFDALFGAFFDSTELLLWRAHVIHAFIRGRRAGTVSEKYRIPYTIKHRGKNKTKY